MSIHTQIRQASAGLIVLFFLFSPVAIVSQASAVVVGISQFRDAQLAELRYANRDASAFADFLLDPQGGSLGAENVQLLTDQEATLAAIQSALKWQRSLPDSVGTAYLYVATHGDVEAENITSGGYLLAHDSPPNNYDLLALSVSYLNEHIRALTARGIKVIFLSDACHAGTLAGNTISGRMLTATSLMKRFESEVRLLSCQPYELAHEGEQWGGGRGAFSYHLEAGIEGAADANGDSVVDLGELEDYVRGRVSEDTDREQHPTLAGGRLTDALFTVSADQRWEYDQDRYDRLKQQLEKALLATLPEDAKRDYVRFHRALERWDILGPDDASAYHYRDRLFSYPQMAEWRGMLQERLVTCVLDTINHALTQYLAADPLEIASRDALHEKYRYYGLCLDTIVEEMPESDPIYASTLAKRNYFRGLITRLEADRMLDSEEALQKYQYAIEQLEGALDAYSEAAYLFNERGLLYLRMGRLKEAYFDFKEAMRLSPGWALPYVNMGATFVEQNAERNRAHAEFLYDTAKTLRPDLAYAYMNHGNLLLRLGDHAAALAQHQQAYDISQSNAYVKYNLAHALLRSGTPGRAKGLLDDVLLQTEDVSLRYDALREVGRYHFHNNNLRAAYDTLFRVVEASPYIAGADSLFRVTALKAGKKEEATKVFRNRIDKRPRNTSGYINLSLTDHPTSNKWPQMLKQGIPDEDERREVAKRLSVDFFRAGEFNKAVQALQLGTDPRAAESHFLKAELQAAVFKQEGGIGWQNRALANLERLYRTVGQDEELRASYCERYQTSHDFDAVRELPDFRALCEQ